jgi:transposase-like protein
MIVITETIGQFDSMFGSDKDCRAYLEKIRWPNGFVCPRCGCSDGKRLRNRNEIECRSCKKQTSVTAGTIFHGARCLRKWFLIAASMSRGESALSLSKRLNMSPSSVWMILQRFRSLLAGQFPAEADEVHDSVFNKVIFRLSREMLDGNQIANPAPEQETENTVPANHADPRLDQIIEAVIGFIQTTFRGVSRKFIYHYCASFWYATDKVRWQFSSFIEQGMKTGPIAKTMIVEYRSPRLVKIILGSPSPQPVSI